MRINNICPQKLNKVSVVENLNLEGSIYNSDLFGRFQKMSVSKKLKQNSKQ